ncbi:MAG: hypothetical protein R3F65_09685 [bacterium]|nr:hypothetical protein [Myxococcales bacterium]
MVVLMTMLALFSTSGAQPEMFGLVPVDSILSPPGDGGIGYSTADMVSSFGWQPTTYHQDVLRELFGEPRQVAPDVRGWAFAAADAPEFGVVLVPLANGRVRPSAWDWGHRVPIGRVKAWRATKLTCSAWLNALAAFQREVHAAERAAGDGR